MTLIVVSGNPIRVCILLASMFFVYIFHGPRCTTPKPCNASIKACGRSGGPLAGLFLLLLKRGGDTWHWNGGRSLSLLEEPRACPLRSYLVPLLCLELAFSPAGHLKWLSLQTRSGSQLDPCLLSSWNRRGPNLLFQKLAKILQERCVLSFRNLGA